MSHPQRWMSAGGSSREPNAPAIYVLPPQSTMVRFDKFLVWLEFSKQFQVQILYVLSITPQLAPQYNSEMVQQNFTCLHFLQPMKLHSTGLPTCDWLKHNA